MKNNIAIALSALFLTGLLFGQSRAVAAEQDPNKMPTVNEQMQKAIEDIRHNDQRGIFYIMLAALNAVHDNFIASDPNREIKLQHILNDGPNYSHDKDGMPRCIKCAQKLLLKKDWILSPTCTKVQSGNPESQQQYNFTIKPAKYIAPQNPDCDCNSKLEWPGTPDPGFPNGQIE